MKEEDIPKVVEMLMAGGKMLAVHCGSCMSPLFEYQGRVVCPVCGGRAKKSVAETKDQALDKVRATLQAKIDALAEQLAKETDHAKTLELLDRIKSALEALERLKEG
ncbi:MAG: Sjogren's syndrome/scleroderma autoantigen 1 family protein [Candidatus Hadarchaeum sp.]|uniref:Sjogren's syndrome/scleroderma autoantigen 1 family protein n=1 Tax=Candidatus Hadarchaeum sp. TaxID=2883567 RepID=UPI003D1317F0